MKPRYRLFRSHAMPKFWIIATTNLKWTGCLAEWID